MSGLLLELLNERQPEAPARKEGVGGCAAAAPVFGGARSSGVGGGRGVKPARALFPHRLDT
jgi:hypothetical protein